MVPEVGSTRGQRVRDPEAAARELFLELRASVRARLVSDVPLGVFLSGGIDSSTVAAFAAEARGGDLDTFAIGFEDKTFDEAPYARRVAAHLKVRHHEERLSPRVLLDLLPSIGRLLDEPIGDGSIVPTHLLAKFTRKHVTVALGGDGGDELFSGYPTFQAERVARLLDHVPKRVRAVVTEAGSRLAARLPVGTGYMALDFKLEAYPGARRGALGRRAAPGVARLVLTGRRPRAFVTGCRARRGS